MKIQRISQFQTILPLTTFGQHYTAYQAAFLETDFMDLFLCNILPMHLKLEEEWD